MCRRWKKRGVKGYKMTYWFAAYVPSGTPADGVARLNDILVKAAYSSGAAGFYQSTGTEIFTNTPVALGKFQTAESLKRGPHHRGGGGSRPHNAPPERVRPHHGPIPGAIDKVALNSRIHWR